MTTTANRGKVTTFRPKDLSAKTGICRAAILRAIKSGELRALRVNARTFIIESQDAAQWVELLTTTQPGAYRSMRAQSHTTPNNLLA